MGSRDLPMESYRVLAGGRVDPRKYDAIRRVAVGFKQPNYSQKQAVDAFIKFAQSHGDRLDHPNNIFLHASGSCLKDLNLRDTMSVVVIVDHETFMGEFYMRIGITFFNALYLLAPISFSFFHF